MEGLTTTRDYLMTMGVSRELASFLAIGIAFLPAYLQTFLKIRKEIDESHLGVKEIRLKPGQGMHFKIFRRRLK